MSERAGDPKKARGVGRRNVLCLLLALALLCAACGQAPQPQIQQLRSDDFTAALERDEIRSVLVIGDSISDGNGDVGCLYDQQERARAGNRLILTDEAGNAYYENAADAQGWVTDFRAYLAENSAVSVFHNAAISGKSTKWFNAHKEALFSGGNDRYDAIFVMLGTNDRSDCQSGGEFQAEYGSLLEYLKGRCDYLTVLVPIPAIYDPTDTAKHLTSRQIAEQVIALCQEQGYRYIDCYHGLPQYAADCGTPLGTLYWGGTHPNAAGYEALWQVIAREPEGAAQPEPVEEITCMGCNLPELAGDTPADALTPNGTPVYPPGISWYYTWNAFTAALPHGAFIETHRDSGGTAVQYARSTQYHKTTFAYIRTWQDGAWSGWSDL